MNWRWSATLLVVAAAAAWCLAVACPVRAASSCFTKSALSFTSERGGLWVNGSPFKLKGASWFGFETSNNIVHGLWQHPHTFYLDFLANNSFNAIRVPQ